MVVVYGDGGDGGDDYSDDSDMLVQEIEHYYWHFSLPLLLTSHSLCLPGRAMSLSLQSLLF
jgi:hypothetical protein